MESTSIDPYGRRWVCQICGHLVTADPTPHGDATCARCGSRMWFDLSARTRLASRRESLMGLGATIARDHRSHSWEIDFTGADVGDEQIRLLPTLGKVTELQLAETQITDSALLTVAKLRTLEVLELGNTRITDAGMPLIGSLFRLELLGLSGTCVTDTGVVRLAPLRRLWWLDLDNTKVTAACLADLAVLQQLEMLYLSHVSLGDSAIPHLSEFRRLEELHVVDSGITLEGFVELRRALPRCTVHWSP